VAVSLGAVRLDNGGDLLRDVGRAEHLRVGLYQGRRGRPDREHAAQLLDGLRRPDGEHRRGAGRGGGHLHGQLDGAALVVGDGEPDVAAVDRLGVVGELHLPRGLGDPLHADQDVDHQPLILSFVGSSSGVASTEPTVTG
jgi:hypothetical protein